MKTIIILITIVIATTTISCEKDTATICENLLEQGSEDAEVITLVGVTEEQATHEEKYFNSIEDAICFVIIDNNKLMIHYKMDNDRKNNMVF